MRDPGNEPLSTTSRHSLLLMMMGVLALALAVHGGALGTWFAQDDITFLLRAARHLPHPGLARWLSAGLAIAGEHAAFGLSPVGYHAVNLLLHGLNTLGVWALALALTRRRLAALLAAVIFGTSSIAFTPLHWVTGIIELLAAACLLGATLVHWRPGPPGGSRVLTSALLLVAALLSKETAIPWIAVMVVADGVGGRDRSHAISLILPGVLTVGFAAWLLTTGIALDTARHGAYSTSFSPASLGANLATYIGWCVAAWNAIPDAIATSDPDAWRLALPACVVLWLAASGLPASRRSPIQIGVAWWLAFLIPVLPLAGRTYYYYLYVPWIGGSIALAALVTGMADRLGARRALLACVAVAAIDAALQWRDVSLRGGAVQDHLPIDPILRDSQLIRHAVSGLESARLPAGSSVGFVNPVVRPSAAPPRGRSLGEGLDTTRSYIPLEAALRGGETLELLAPELHYRGFSSTIPPDWLDVECFHYEQRGWLEHWGRGPQALLRQARLQMSTGQTMAAESTYQRARALGAGRVPPDSIAALTASSRSR